MRRLEADFDSWVGPNMGVAMVGSSPANRSSCTVAKFSTWVDITAWFLARERRLGHQWSNPCAKKCYLCLIPKLINYQIKSRLKLFTFQSKITKLLSMVKTDRREILMNL